MEIITGLYNYYSKTLMPQTKLFTDIIIRAKVSSVKVMPVITMTDKVSYLSPFMRFELFKPKISVRICQYNTWNNTAENNTGEPISALR